MRIEILLRQLLKEIDKDERGILKELAADTKTHRHTIENLYHNRAENPSLELLSKICDWLQRKGIASERLPQALFGRGPQEMWEACVRHGAVTLYLGENREQSPGPRRPLWISKRDTALAFQLVRLLSDPTVTGRRGTEIYTEYSPYHFPLDQGQKPNKQQFQKDIAEARELYRGLDRPMRASILIGSIKTNYPLEFLVAGLFGCRPFQPFSPERNKLGPPVYMQYRETDRRIPSCMAGEAPPNGFGGQPRPGIYFVEENGKWRSAQSLDTGIVLVAYEPGTQKFQLAVFGFRGRTTQALGTQLKENPAQFWSEDDIGTGHPRVRITLCGFSFRNEHRMEDDGRLEWTLRLAPQVLRDRLVR